MATSFFSPSLVALGSLDMSPMTRAIVSYAAPTFKRRLLRGCDGPQSNGKAGGGLPSTLRPNHKSDARAPQPRCDQKPTPPATRAKSDAGGLLLRRQERKPAAAPASAFASAAAASVLFEGKELLLQFLALQL